jgi:hypothetical protein
MMARLSGVRKENREDQRYEGNKKQPELTISNLYVGQRLLRPLDFFVEGTRSSTTPNWMRFCIWSMRSTKT